MCSGSGPLNQLAVLQVRAARLYEEERDKVVKRLPEQTWTFTDRQVATLLPCCPAANDHPAATHHPAALLQEAEAVWRAGVDQFGGVDGADGLCSCSSCSIAFRSGCRDLSGCCREGASTLLRWLTLGLLQTSLTPMLLQMSQRKSTLKWPVSSPM